MYKRQVERSLVGRVTSPLPASPEAIPLASELRHLFGDTLIIGREPRLRPGGHLYRRDYGCVESVSYTHLDVYKRQHLAQLILQRHHYNPYVFGRHLRD